MAKIRLEDVYDDDDDDLQNNSATGIRTHKHKNPLKDSDDIYAKNKSKKNTCKIKQRRKVKNEF